MGAFDFNRLTVNRLPQGLRGNYLHLPTLERTPGDERLHVGQGPETKLLARPKAESEYTTRVKDVNAAQVVLSLVLADDVAFRS